MVLLVAQTHTLVFMGIFHPFNWDLSDAYLRPARQDETNLNILLDFGPWSTDYFPWVVLFVLIDDRFTEGFVPEVGYNQGGNSGQAYQPGCIIMSSILLKGYLHTRITCAAFRCTTSCVLMTGASV